MSAARASSVIRTPCTIRWGSRPVRFASNLALWAITSWLALRYGLTREDRLALGGLSRKLRLV